MDRAGFVPGFHVIDAYGNGGFRFADMSHRGSILLLPTGVHALDLVEGDAIAALHVQALLAEPRGTVDLLLIGTGRALVPVSEALRWIFRERNIGVEAMPTGAAARTYNVLTGERRRVAALLVAVP